MTEITYIPDQTVERAIPSSEIFPSEDQLIQNAREALRTGTVTTSLFNADGDRGSYPDIYPTLKISQKDLVSELTADEKKWGFYRKASDELEFANPDDIVKRTAEEAEERIVEAVASRNAWYLNDPRIAEHVTEGTVSEAFEIGSPDKPAISVVNFSAAELSSEQVESLRSITDKINQLSAGRIFDAVRAICIMPKEDFEGKVIGMALGLTGTIKLHEGLIDGSIEAEEKAEGHDVKFSEQGLSLFESTLTHEAWHLLEFKDTEFNAFAQSTGWESEYVTTVDDYGMVIGGNIETLNPLAYAIKISDKNGELKDVNARDEFGLEVMQGAKPVTQYGSTNNREDSAEAFVPYVHTERTDRKSLDPIRRNALTGMLQRMASTEAYGPRQTAVTRINPYDIARIQPEHLTVDEPRYSLDADLADSRNNPFVEDDIQEALKANYSDSEKWYGLNKKRVIDDYGEEVTTHNRRMPYQF